MKSLPPEFVSCDWGTSNFRLRHVTTETLEVLSSHKTGMGVRKLHDHFMEQKAMNRFHCFSSYLTAQLAKLETIDTREETVIVVSGMASSSIGMHELDYSRVPFDASGSTLSSQSFSAGKLASLILISGVKTDEDVMRGEETQAVGLADGLPLGEQGILILPGTHSKHISFAKGQYWNFKTFLTGELYETLSCHGILKDSIAKTPWHDRHTGFFLEGVRRGSEDLAGSLFTTRAKDLLAQQTKEENGHFLSGVLIGSELGYLRNIDDRVYLAAPAGLSQPYRRALEMLLSPNRFSFFEESTLEKALLLGQKKILAART